MNIPISHTIEEEGEINLLKRCNIISIVGTINNSFQSCLLTTNIAISFARQGYKVLLLDLNLSQPTIGLLLKDYNHKFTTNMIYDRKFDINEVLETIFTKQFLSSGGEIKICPANTDIKQRIKIQDMSTKDLKTSLSILMNFINAIKEKFDFIFLNMPVGFDFSFLIQGTLISDYNFLLLEHESVSITYGLDLFTNLEAIHPLIEFKGIILYNYVFNPNFIDDERPIIENTFELPIITVLPEIPNLVNNLQIELLKETNIDPKYLSFFKIFSQELMKFIIEPHSIQYQNKTNIDILIVSNNSGIPLFTSYLQYKDTNQPVIISQDEILTSATLTAIIAGVGSVLKEISKDTSGETRLIKQKHLNLVVEHSKPLRAMVLTRRSEDFIRPKLITFLNSFKNKYKLEIESFIGSAQAFSTAIKLVEEIF